MQTFEDEENENEVTHMRDDCFGKSKKERHLHDGSVKIEEAENGEGDQVHLEQDCEEHVVEKKDDADKSGKQIKKRKNDPTRGSMQGKKKAYLNKGAREKRSRIEKERPDNGSDGSMEDQNLNEVGQSEINDEQVDHVPEKPVGAQKITPRQLQMLGRFLLRECYLSGVTSAKDAHDQVQAQMGPRAPRLRTAQFWYCRFNKKEFDIDTNCGRKRKE